MPAQERVFFSYAREDGDFALRLARDLRSAGQDLWLDQLDIPAGRRWDRSVEDALKSCPRFLVILSPSSVNSQNVLDEVSFALEQGKLVIPVLYKTCEIPFRLRRVQYVDFMQDYDPALAQMLKVLAARLSGASSETRRVTEPGSPAEAQRVAATETEKAAASRQAPKPKRWSGKWMLAGGFVVVVAGIVIVASMDNAGPPPIPAPIAKFTASPVSGSAPLTVTFEDQSSGDIAEYHWDFGDENASHERNPRHTYAEAHAYTVRLEVTGPSGVDSFVIPDFIKVGAVAEVGSGAQVDKPPVVTPDPPKAQFRAEPTTGTAPLTVSFTTQSSGEISEHHWDFGDGNASHERDPKHTYAAARAYTVRLTVTGPGGSQEEIKSGFISVAEAVPAPVAQFKADHNIGQAPLTVAFSTQSSGKITGYLWEFGDGNSSRRQHPRHRYTTPGSYSVRLTVTGPGGKDTEVKNRFVVVAAPSVNAAGFLQSRVNRAACFHKRDGGWANGNPIHIWACDAGSAENKTWIYEPSTGYIRAALNRSKCLHKRDGGFNNGNPIHLWDCDAGPIGNKSWRYDPSTGYIHSRANAAKCLHKRDGGFNNGNPIHLWDCAPGPAENKTWNIRSP